MNTKTSAIPAWPTPIEPAARQALKADALRRARVARSEYEMERVRSLLRALAAPLRRVTGARKAAAA